MIIALLASMVMPQMALFSVRSAGAHASAVARSDTAGNFRMVQYSTARCEAGQWPAFADSSRSRRCRTAALTAPATALYRPSAFHELNRAIVMPTYEYLCENCGKRFSRIDSIAAHRRRRPSCLACKSSKVTRVFTAFFAKTIRKS